MQIFLTIIIFTFLSLAALGEGTFSTDDNSTSKAEASLSGYEVGNLEVEEDEIEAQEAQKEEEFYLDEEEPENIQDKKIEHIKSKNH